MTWTVVRPSRWIGMVGPLWLVLAGCGSAGEDQVSLRGGEAAAATTTVGAEQLLPVVDIEAYELPVASVSELADRADIVAVGEVNGVRRDVYRLSGGSEDPTGNVTSFDAFAIQVVDQVRGTSVDEYLLAIPARLLSGDDPVATIRPSTWPVSESGIGDRMMVFAIESPHQGAKGAYLPVASFGVLRIDESGNLRSRKPGDPNSPLGRFEGRSAEELLEALR